MYVEGGRNHWKIRSYGIYTEIKQLGHNVIKMKLKCHEVVQHNIHYQRPTAYVSLRLI